MKQSDIQQIAALVAQMLTGQAQPAQTVAAQTTAAPVAAQAQPAQTSPRPSPIVPDARPDAELYAKIGIRKDSRMTLPVGMFKSWSSVVLIFPDGFQMGAQKDVEGRGRISRKEALAHSGAQPGQYFTFHEQTPGYFIVNVTGTPAALAQTNGQPTPVPLASAPLGFDRPAALTVQLPTVPPAAQTTAAPTVPALSGNFAEAFARLFQAQPAAQAQPEKVKRTRSPKQLANDERLRQEARNRKAAEASGVVANGQPLTPIYAIPQTLPQGLPGFNAGARPVPVPNVGAAQMQFAGVSPVPVK